LVIFYIWVTEGNNPGRAFQETIARFFNRAATGSRPFINPYTSGGEVESHNAATYFSDDDNPDYLSELRLIAQRTYGGNRLNNPADPDGFSLNPNLYPGLQGGDIDRQGRFRPNTGLYRRNSFVRLSHTEPRFLRTLGMQEITPRGTAFLHDIIGISRWPMCGLCTRLLLNYFINREIMGQINPAEHPRAPINIIILTNKLVGDDPRPLRLIDNNILEQAALYQADDPRRNYITDGKTQTITRLRETLAPPLPGPPLFTGTQNWFVVFSN
jgi:hypothetical protein